MNGRKSREIRKAAHEAADLVGVGAAGAIGKVVAYAVSIDQRTKALEGLVDYAEKTERLTQSLADWRARPFLGRMRWLILGR